MMELNMLGTKKRARAAVTQALNCLHKLETKIT